MVWYFMLKTMNNLVCVAAVVVVLTSRLDRVTRHGWLWELVKSGL